MNTRNRILVCGAGGFIGHHLVKRLKTDGHWVRGVDIKPPEYEPTAADEFELLDLRRWDNCLQATRGGIDQVYQLAAHLGVPEEIRRRPPTTDTWSLAQTQDEFYFSLPYDRMDLCLYGLDHGVAAAAVARAAALSESQVERVWRDIQAKRKATRYLHEPPLLVETISTSS